jgi:hypothetical protein
MVNYHDAAVFPNRVRDGARFVFAGTIFDAAFHVNDFAVSAPAISAASARKP